MSKIKQNIIYALIFIASNLLGSCESYLDVVPDNLATIEDAFSMRTNAEKYLFTCYSYMPKDADVASDFGLLGGDEIWAFTSIPSGVSQNFSHTLFGAAQGLQNKISPIGNNKWDDMYKAIRDCNIFLENMDKVPDMDDLEKQQWISEVKFLKAYYHFYLIKHYGPIPIVDKSLPIDATIDEVRVTRQPINECFDYVVKLLDESVAALPPQILDPQNSLGRITQPIALALKAQVLVFYASPLYNGNSDFSALVNKDGTQLFPQGYDADRWVKAAEACKAAIDICESNGIKLHYYQNSVTTYSIATKTQLSLRTAITDRWNDELIWGNSQSWATDIQRYASAWVNETNTDNTEIRHELAVPLKICDQYYSKNGVPIEEDITWDYNGRYGVKVASTTDFPNIKSGYETTKYHFDRENRYYANIGFDGGIWYGQGKYAETDLWHIRTKLKQPNNANPTGTYIKKLVSYENVQTAPKGYSVNKYPWPIIRLADLYLMYSEAVNEVDGPTAEAKLYIDKVRQRAGLLGIDQSWSNFSNNPAKPNSKEGLREIIQKERLIELAFEGKRYWDIRRWKTAPTIMNKDVLAWNQSQEAAVLYSNPQVIFTQTFGIKDYFLPIKDSYIINNRNLVQNLGW